MFGRDSLQCNNLLVRHLQFQLLDLHISQSLYLMHCWRNCCQYILRDVCFGVCLQLHSLDLSSKLHTKLCNLRFKFIMFCLQHRVQSDVRWKLPNLPFSNLLQLHEQLVPTLPIKLRFMRFRVFL